MKTGIKIASIICFSLCFSATILKSQITVNNYTALTNAQVATALVDSLVGNGIVFSNVSFQGVRNSGGSYGYQTCYFTTVGTTATQMGITRGIALTSGNTNLISIGMATNPGASNSFSKGYTSGTPGEIRKSTSTINDMNVLAGAVNWFNGAILEFDFVPTGDSIVFKYVFGGEEYSDNTNFTNYQCSQYNDKFGFLISGPGISGGVGYTSDARNISRLSNGSEVGINSVNNGTVGSSGTPNGPSYCTNANPSWTNGTPTPEFNGTIAGTAPNGNTDILFATQGGLTPGQTYHIRLLICDASDGAYDAIVYIEAGSFTSPAPTLSLTATPSTICNGENTWVVANLTNGTPPFTYSWSNGTVHNSSNMADSIQVSPAANATYSITVTDATAATFTDSQLITVNGLTTPTFTALGPYCRLASPAVLPTTSTNGITGTWSPATISTASTGSTTYNFTANSGQCASNTSMSVTVNALPTAAITNNSGTTILTCTQTAISVTATGGSSYAWSGGSTPATAANSLTTAGSYTVTVTNASGCTATSSITITGNTTPPTAAITNNTGSTVVTCSTPAISVTATGGGTYAWSGGATPATAANSFSAAGTYTVTVTAANGCTDTESITITSNTTPPTAGITNNTGTTILTCTVTTISVTATGGGTYNWGGGVTTAARNLTAAGTYTVTVTAANGCTDTESITITSNSTPPTAAITNNSGTTVLNCTTTTINVTATGGGTYNWGGGITTAANSFTAAGTYTVTVTGANGCTATSSITITGNTTPPTAAITNNTGSTVVTCSTPSISVTATGGGTYNWGGGVTTAANSFIAAGTYTVTVTAANGCTDTESITITSNTTPPTAGITNNSGTTVLTCTITTISVTATGGGTYNWGGGITTAARNLTAAGTYTVTVTSANGCTDTESITITSNSTPPTAAITNNSGTTVLNCTTTTINVTATGGGTYNWGGGITTAANNFTAAGTYTVTVTGANGCTATSSLTITGNTTPPTAAITNNTGSTVVTCSTPAISVTATGGGTYNWGGGITTAANSFSATGTYTVTVTAANGCTDTENITITSNTTPPTAGITNNTGTTVLTCTVTSISVTATGGGTYNWGGGITTAARNLTAAGTYTVTVTAANGCTDTESITITSNTTPPTAAITNNSGTTVLNCTITTINVTATGGGSYNWGGGITTAANSFTVAGTYTVTVTGANGCTATSSITITGNTTPPTAAITNNTGSTVVTCSTPAISVTATGGGTYNWGGGITTAANSFSATGTYTVTVTAANGCTDTENITISSNTTPPTAGITNNSGTTILTCTQTSISLTATGGGTYSWNGGSSPATAVNSVNAPATYTVTVTAANGCTDTESITITQNVILPTATITNNTGTTVLNCNITSISVLASGGTTYSWSGGATPSLAANSFNLSGTYTLTVTNASGCTDTEVITITQNITAPAATITNNTGSTELNCNTLNISATANGGVTYTWNGGSSPNSTNNNFNIPGTYTVTVTGANGCTSQQSLILTQNIVPPSALISNMTGTTELNCNTSSISVTASGGGTYAWSGGSTPASATNSLNNPGVYTVTVTGTNGCSDTENISISQNIAAPVAGILNNSATSQLDCNNSSISLTATGGNLYAWNSGSSPNQANNSITNSGNYVVTVTAVNGCTDTESINITQVIPPSVSLNPTNAQCGVIGGSINTVITNGSQPYSILWSNTQSSQNISNLAPGTYRLTVTDDDNCTATASSDIFISGNINTSITQTQLISCNGENTGSLLAQTSNGNAPSQYIWSNGSNNSSISNLFANTYSVTITDNWGCTGTASSTLINPLSMQLNPVISNISCNGETNGNILLAVSGGNFPYTYIWDNSQNTSNLSELTAGSYTVTVSDNINCSISQTFNIIEPEKLTLNETHETVKCYGTATGEITMSAIGGTAPYQYSVSNGTYNSNGYSHNNLPAGTYSLVVTDNSGCISIKDVEIYEPAALEANYISSNPTCKENTDGYIQVIINGGTEPYLYAWDENIIDINLISGLRQGVYSISITDSNDCIVTINSIDITDTPVDCIKIPNAFTPNTDGINDTWIIEGREIFPDAVISVYNRWGQLLYSARGDGEAWDGTYNGKFVPAGTYVYIIDLVRNAKNYNGVVTVVY